VHDLDALEGAVKAAEVAGDGEKLLAAREAYVAADPSGPGAAEQRYRLGLQKLFLQQDKSAAMELFKAAAGEKGAPVAAEARISLALLLHGSNKRQQAMFELRKMLPQGAAPSIHTAQALDFLSMVMRESGQPQNEIMAVDKQRIDHLGVLAQAAKSPVEKAHYLLRQAAAYADGGTGTDLALARKKYDEVVKLGAAAGDSALSAAKNALKILPR
jgi:hypothetical protein